MSLPNIAVRKSIKVQVEAGKTYLWCSCGYSKSQPFCDGSHQGSSFKPLAFTASADGIVGFCGCKFTKNAPICDGYHKNLVDTSNENL